LNIKKLEYNEEVTNNESNMKTTVKELSDKLGVDVVYVNGFLQTLVKIGKAEVVGKVEKPAGSRGKPSNIYLIADGIL
jgi:predicted ArsR family transcriptional regulator